MKAAVVHQFGQPLRIEDVEIPRPGHGQVLSESKRRGCATPTSTRPTATGRSKPNPPFIPGHEGVGIVERTRRGGDRLSEGDRVAVPWLGWACGACELCASGWETLCPSASYTGYTVNGGFAEYVVAEAAFVAKVPDTVDPVDAAPLTCAGVTTYKAVKVSGARSSDLVAIFGVGGLGHLAVQYAQIAGATVAAVDVVDAKLELAKRLGAAYTFNGRTEDPVDAIQALGGADVAIVLAATPRAYEQAFASLQAQRHPGRRRSARRQHHAPSNLRDGAPGHHGGRVARRDPCRSGRDVRTARRRSHSDRARRLASLNRSTRQSARSNEVRWRPAWYSTSEADDYPSSPTAS